MSEKFLPGTNFGTYIICKEKENLVPEIGHFKWEVMAD